MADFGLTDTGFVLKRTVDIQSDLLVALSSITDPETGEPLTIVLSDENDPVAQIVNALADGLGVCWEQLQLVYNQFDPLKNSGAGQSGTVQLNGMTRLPGSYSQVILFLTGTPYLAIPAGKQAGTTDGTVTFTLPAVTLDDLGEAFVVAVAPVKGALAAPSGTVTEIITAVPGWSSVTNAEDATLGTLEETDSELRARQQVSTALTSNAIVESIFSGIASISGVTFCKVYQNTTLLTDARTIPAKSIAVVVQGGADADIAALIFARNPLAGTYGTTTINITDVQGIEYPIRFSRPVSVDVYVDIAITVVNVTAFPANAEGLIRAGLLAFSIIYLPGGAVYGSDLYAPIGSACSGIKITSVTVARTESPVDDEADFSWNEIVNFTSEKITITVTGA